MFCAYPVCIGFVQTMQHFVSPATFRPAVLPSVVVCHYRQHVHFKLRLPHKIQPALFHTLFCPLHLFRRWCASCQCYRPKRCQLFGRQYPRRGGDDPSLRLYLCNIVLLFQYHIKPYSYYPIALFFRSSPVSVSNKKRPQPYNAIIPIILYCLYYLYYFISIPRGHAAP